MEIDVLDWSIILPALCAGFAVLLSHVPLGCEVLKRGIIFIDLAIAQFAGLGVIIAHVIGLHADDYLQVQLVALISALLGAWLLSYSENRFRESETTDISCPTPKLHQNHLQEAFIGICFILAASVSILLLSYDAHGGEHLQDLLVGQILWTEWQQLIVPAIIGLLICFLSVKKSLWLRGRSFYFLFAIAITLSVQLVGVYLVFASLIIPALILQLIKKSIIFGFIVGGLGYLIGLIFSSLFDLPSGAIIICTMTIVAIVFSTIFSLFTNTQQQ